MGLATNSHIGSVGEVSVAYNLINRGWSVYTSIVADNVQHFDLIACKPNSLQRIQVKSTSKIEKGENRYTVTVAMGSNIKRPYTSEHTDFIIAVILPVSWHFIFPVGEVKTQLIRFPVDCKPTHKYAPFRDAWHLLDYAPKAGT